MSTFTQFNGPQSMPSTKAITDLIDAYNNISATLHKHMADNADSGVHNVKTYVDTVIQNLRLYEEIDKKINALDLPNAYVSTTKFNTELTKTAKVTDVADISNRVTDATNTADAAKGTADGVREDIGALISLHTTAKTSVVAAINEVNDSLSGLLRNINDPDWKHKVAGIIEVSKYVLADLKPRAMIDFCKWHKFTATYAGTGAPIDTSKSGLYLIGMVSSYYDDTDMVDNTLSRSKAGRMYLKVLNSEPLDCIIDYAITFSNDDKCTGTVQTVCSKGAGAWPGLKLHIVHGTDGTGEPHAWLGISCDKLPTGHNTGTLECYAAGINCIPVGYTGYKAASNVVHEISHTAIADTGTGQIITEAITTNTLYTDKLVDLRGNTIVQSNAIEDTAGVRHYTLEIGKGGADNGHGDPVVYDDVLFHVRPEVLLNTPDGTITAPVITTYEADNLEVPVGGMLRWPATAVAIPACYAKADGSLLEAAVYKDLAQIIPPDLDGMIKLPNETNSIIRVTRYDMAKATTAPATPELTNYITLSDRLKKLEDSIQEEDNSTAELEARITAEAEARELADTALGTRIDEEATARTDADTALGTRVDDETRARTAGDTNLLALNASTNTRITKLHNGSQDAQRTDAILLAPLDAAANANLTLRHDIATDTLAPFTLYTFNISGNVSMHTNGVGVVGAWVGVSLPTEPTVTGFRCMWVDDPADIINWSRVLDTPVLDLERNVDGHNADGVAIYIDKAQRTKRYMVLQLIDNADDYVYWLCVDAAGVNVV